MPVFLFCGGAKQAKTQGKPTFTNFTVFVCVFCLLPQSTNSPPPGVIKVPMPPAVRHDVKTREIPPCTRHRTPHGASHDAAAGPSRCTPPSFASVFCVSAGFGSMRKQECVLSIIRPRTGERGPNVGAHVAHHFPSRCSLSNSQRSQDTRTPTASHRSHRDLLLSRPRPALLSRSL